MPDPVTPNLVARSAPSTLRQAQGSGRAERTEPLECGSVRPSRRTSATAFTAAPPGADDPLLAFAPYLHPRPRRNSITPAKQRAFISTLAATGIVTQSARSIGVSLEALYKLRRLAGAEGFAAAWEAQEADDSDAVFAGIDAMLDSMRERTLANDDLLAEDDEEGPGRRVRFRFTFPYHHDRQCP